MNKTTFIAIVYIVFLKISIHGQPIQKKDSLRLIQLADSAFELHSVNFKKAVNLSNYVTQKAIASKSNYLKLKAFYTSAYLDWFNGAHFEALSKCNKSLLLSKIEKDTFMVAENYMLQGLAYLYLSEYDSSLYAFNQGLQHYKFIHDTTNVLRNYGFIGLVYNKQSNYIKAKENLIEQVVLQRQLDAPEWNVIRFDDNESNIKYFEESLINAKEVLKKYKNDPMPSKNKRFAYRNLGLIYRELGIVDSALFYLKKSVAIAQQLNADAIWFDLAKIYLVKGIYDSAFWAVDKSIVAAKDHGTRIFLSYSYSTKGHIYVAQHELAKGINMYKKALSLEKEMHQKSAQMKLYHRIANRYFDNSQFATAQSYADSSLAIARNIGAKRDIANALELLSKSYKQVGNYAKALALKEAYDVITDNLQKGKVQLELAKLDLFNEVELNKLEISDLNKQKKLAEANAKNKNLIIILVLVVFLFVALLFILNFSRAQKLLSLNKKLHHQQQLIANQNQELTQSNSQKELLLGEIHHRVKNNLQTITSLLGIQQRKLSDKQAKQAMEDSKNRILTMALIHEHLYKHNNFSDIDLGNYMHQLLDELIASNAAYPIEIKYNITEVKMTINQAIYIGLIINELAINSIKHAFIGVNNPCIKLSLLIQSAQYKLKYQDNGKSKNYNLNRADSFGWKLIENLTDKLEGSVETDTTNGFKATFIFSHAILNYAN